MFAQPSTDIPVESVEEYAGVGFLTVRLAGDDHYSMYQSYKGLPAVLKMAGRRYGKSCWNSDRQCAYYRTDMLFAST